MSASQTNSVVSNSGSTNFYVGKNKRTFDILFDTCPIDDKYIICKLCPVESLKKRKRKGAGYHNAMSHLKTHPGYESYLETDHESQVAQRPLVSEPAIQVYSWMDWIISDNLPFAFLTKKTTKKYANIKPISIPTFTKYMNRVTKIVEEKISKKLGSKFGVMIDGWDAKAFSIVGIYANNYLAADPEDRHILLAASPMLDGESFTAATHAAFIADTLSGIYGKEPGSIQYIVADNTETMPATARALNVPFIGCASHRLHLAVSKYVVDNHSALVSRVNENMILLKTKKNRGKLLRLGCNLSPRVRTNKWASLYEMMLRYSQFLENGVFDDWEDMQLDLIEKEEMKTLLRFLKECNIVSLQTQKV